MPAARKSVTTSAEGVAEANRLRLILEDVPPVATADLEAASPSPGVASQQDWSTTLDNIARMAAILRKQDSRLADAESRAQQAEARAQEAETWLRRLHQAVLDGLPAARPA